MDGMDHHNSKDIQRHLKTHMKTIKGIIAAIAISATSLLSPAKAETRDHTNLLNALDRAGVRVIINHKNCGRDGSAGWYQSSIRTLVVCQDNYNSFSGPVSWTANDYDTLRHEAHHVVQDCVHGEIGDTELGPMFLNEDDYVSFVTSIISEDTRENIMQAYRGSSDFVLMVELEAFAVATAIHPDSIARSLDRLCASS